MTFMHEKEIHASVGWHLSLASGLIGEREASEAPSLQSRATEPSGSVNYL